MRLPDGYSGSLIYNKPYSARSRKPLERDIEKKACKGIRALGGITRKMNGLGFRSWPDRLIIGNGFAFWIEFKRPGEEPTPLQRKLHDQLGRMSQTVYVFDNAEQAVEIFREWKEEYD